MSNLPEALPKLRSIGSRLSMLFDIVQQIRKIQMLSATIQFKHKAFNSLYFAVLSQYYYFIQYSISNLKMSQEVEAQILELCENINEKCEIDGQNFTFDILKTEQWYLQILSILCPYLEEELTKIQALNNSEKAINSILKLINSLDQFNEDVTEIVHGKEVVSGNKDHISYMVQIFHTLLEAALKQQEEQPSGQEKQEEEKSQDLIQSESARYSEEMKSRSRKKERSSSEKLSKSQSQRHSVLGINNQFEKSQQYESQQFEANQQKKEKFSPFANSIEKSIYPKLTQPKQPQTYPHFYSDNKKDSSSQQQSENPYLHQKMGKTIQKKNNVIVVKKKNPQRDAITYGTKKPKKLIEHPPKVNTLKKAKSAEQIKLTKKVQGKIRQTHKKSKRQTTTIKRVKSPLNNEMKKKKTEMNYFTNEFRKSNTQKEARKLNKRYFQQKNETNLKKLLNWREEKMKRQRKQFQMGMKAKVQSKKEEYIKKVNNLIIKLEKDKQIQQKKQFKENLIKQNQQAVKRMTSLEKWYKDKLDMLKDNKKNKRSQQHLLKTGHKEIVNQLEKQLKKQNQKKLLTLTQQFRQEETNIANDLEQLQHKIIKVYKKN